MSEDAAKRQSKKVKFHATQRKVMVEDLEKVDSQLLVDSAVQQLKSGVRLQRYDMWHEFSRCNIV